MAYKRPTVALIRQMERDAAIAAERAYARGHRAGMETNRNVAKRAMEFALRTRDRERVLRIQLELMTSDVFVRGHDGTKPLR